jgi:hypothetical protein
VGSLGTALQRERERERERARNEVKKKVRKREQTSRKERKFQELCNRDGGSEGK